MWQGTNALIAISIAAICTLLLRALPFLIIGENKKIPDQLDYLGKILPPAIMAVIIVYCCKNIMTDFSNTGIFQIIAVISTALIHLWKRNTYLSIILGTAIYMILIRL